MPHALILAAEWVGNAIVGAITAAAPTALSTEAAIAIADAATAATIVAEVAVAYEITKALTPKVGGNFGTQVDWKADPQAGIPYAVGRTGVAGNIAFKQSAGGKSSYMNFATVYTGAGPIDSYESFTADSNVVLFTADGGQGAAGYYQNRMWRTTQLGASPEASYLHITAVGTKDTPGDHGGMAAEWSATHKLSGYAADYWILQFNTDKYSGGVPQRLTVGKWVKAYDPRKDSTYPGGSGTHRSNDESTWEWTANPYLHALTWLLGRYQNGKRILGVGIPITAIDVGAYVAGANVADANSWTCGGVVYSTDDKYEVLKAFLQAGGGKPMRLGAKVSCLVNTPRTSLATIKSADVVGDVEVAGGISRRNRINTIWPKYREEAQAWQMVVPDQPVTVTSYYAADGGMRSRAIEYPLVQNVNQAAQLARYDIEDSRELTPITLACKPIWMGYRPGDCITANEPEWGLNGQKLLILKRTRDPATMQVTLVCRTETDGKHSFALGQTGVAPSTPALTGYDSNVPAAPAAGVFTLAGVTLSGQSGAVPAIRVSGTPDSPHAAQISVRYRVHGTANWTYWPNVQASTEAAAVIDIPGSPDTAYDAQVAYVSVRGSVSTYTDLGQTTAGTMVGEVPSANLWGKVAYVANAGVAVVAPAFGISGWGYRFPTPGGNSVTVSGKTFALSTDANPGRYSIYCQAALSAGAGTATVRLGFRTAGGAAITDVPDKVLVVTPTVASFTWDNIRSADPNFRNATFQIFTNAGDVGAGKTVDVTDVDVVFGSKAPNGFAPNPNDKQALAMAGYIGALDATRNNTVAQTGAPVGQVDGEFWKDTSQTPPVWNVRLGGAYVPVASLGAKFGTSAYDAGGAVATDSAYKTALGIASGFTGQTAWATYSTWSPTDIANKTQYFNTLEGKSYDYRHVLYTWSVLGPAGRPSNPLSTNTSPAVLVAAHSIYVPTAGGAVTISVPASTNGGLSFDTDYSVFFRPQFGDTFVPAASIGYLYNSSPDGYMFLGNVRTPTGGGTYTAPPGYSGTFDGKYDGCVWADAHLASGQRAGDAAEGDVLTLMAPAGDRIMAGEVSAIRYAEAECFTFTTRLGAVLTLSDSAPVMTRQGPGFIPYAVRAADCEEGMAVPILTEAGELVWDMIEAITPAGRREVAMISARGIGVYAASDRAVGPKLFSHNIYAKP